MGALTYYPEKNFIEQNSSLDLDELAEQCQKILNTEYSEKLDELYHLGGTSGGARPKIMTNIDNEAWIIKFPAHVDGKDSGKMEYDYSCCARQCGITISETRLELDFEQPSLDYHDLMKLTNILTRDNKADRENMFRRMCFNVFAHNRDDHSKNFSYIYNEEKDTWRLSPAYDLTYSSTYNGEHTTSVDGKGKNPGEKELLAVGISAGMKKEHCLSIIDEIKVCVTEQLGKYL